MLVMNLAFKPVSLNHNCQINSLYSDSCRLYWERKHAHSYLSINQEIIHLYFVVHFVIQILKIYTILLPKSALINSWETIIAY